MWNTCRILQSILKRTVNLECTFFNYANPSIYPWSWTDWIAILDFIDSYGWFSRSLNPFSQGTLGFCYVNAFPDLQVYICLIWDGFQWSLSCFLTPSSARVTLWWFSLNIYLNWPCALHICPFHESMEEREREQK